MRQPPFGSCLQFRPSPEDKASGRGPHTITAARTVAPAIDTAWEDPADSGGRNKDMFRRRDLALQIVLDTSRLEPSRDLCSSMLGSRHPLARRLEPGKNLTRADSSRLEPPRFSSMLEAPRYLSMLECSRAARILLQARADLLIPIWPRE